MANQNDNDFIDDDLDGDLSSENSVVVDAVEDASEETSGDISDYDDSEEGIFAPSAQKKKSGSSSALLGTVAIIALLGAGGFYAYTQTDLLSGLKEIVVADTAEVPPADETAPVATSDVAIADPAAIDAQPADPELTAIPQPQPIVNVTEDATMAPDTAMAPPAQDTSASTPVAPDASAPIDMAAATPPATTDPASVAPSPTPPADMPPPPTPVETTAAVEAAHTPPATEPVPAPAPATEPAATPPAPVAATQPAPTAASTEPAPIAAQPVVVPEPQQSTLAAAPVMGEVTGSSSGTGLSADSGQSATKAVPKPSVDAPADTYFDSPGSSAMTRIPTPSLDPTRGKSESIIIVQGAKKSSKKSNNVSSSSSVHNAATDSVAISSSSQEGAIIAAGRALRLGRYDAALDMYSDLYRANPRDGRILMGRAVALQKLGRNAEAINAYEEVLSIDSDNPDAVVNMMGLIRKDRPAVALEKLLDMKQRYPANGAILAQLGVAYADSGNLDDAAAALNAAIRIEPNNPQHYFNLAVISERMKNRPRAIALYEKALEVDAVYGNGRGIDRDMIYDRLARLRG